MIKKTYFIIEKRKKYKEQYNMNIVVGQKLYTDNGGGFIENVTPVVVTDSTNILSLEILTRLFPEIIIVTNVSEEQFDKKKFASCKIINSKSQNFSFLRNLGAYYAPTPFVFAIDSDEELDETAVNSIKNCRFDYSLYSFNTKMYFGDQLLNITEHEVIRLYNKNMHYFVGRVHEKLVQNQKEVKLLSGILLNKSYKDWNQYKKKRIKYVNLEYKRWNLLFRFISPIYVFFKNQGWKDGKIGLMYTSESIVYAIMIVFHGKPKRMFFDLDTLKTIPIPNDLGNAEQKYMQFVVSKFISRTTPPTLAEYELIEQISSAFL